MATNCRVKMGKIGLFVFIHSPGIPNDDLAALCVNLVVNFGPVILEFTMVKYVHPVVPFFKINLREILSHDPLDRFSPNFAIW